MVPTTNSILFWSRFIALETLKKNLVDVLIARIRDCFRQYLSATWPWNSSIDTSIACKLSLPDNLHILF